MPKTSDAQRDVYRRHIQAVYRRWNQEKCDDLDWIMKKYKGQEAEIYDAIVRKYVFCLAECHWRPLVEAMYRRFNPSKLPELDQILGKYKNSQAALYRALCDKYFPTIEVGDPLGELDVWGVWSDSKADSLKTATKKSSSVPTRKNPNSGGNDLMDQSWPSEICPRDSGVPLLSGKADPPEAALRSGTNNVAVSGQPSKRAAAPVKEEPVEDKAQQTLQPVKQELHEEPSQRNPIKREASDESTDQIRQKSGVAVPCSQKGQKEPQAQININAGRSLQSNETAEECGKKGSNIAVKEELPDAALNANAETRVNSGIPASASSIHPDVASRTTSSAPIHGCLGSELRSGAHSYGRGQALDDQMILHGQAGGSTSSRAQPRSRTPREPSQDVRNNHHRTRELVPCDKSMQPKPTRHSWSCSSRPRSQHSASWRSSLRHSFRRQRENVLRLPGRSLHRSAGVRGTREAPRHERRPRFGSQVRDSRQRSVHRTLPMPESSRLSRCRSSRTPCSKNEFVNQPSEVKPGQNRVLESAAHPPPKRARHESSWQKGELTGMRDSLPECHQNAPGDDYSNGPVPKRTAAPVSKACLRARAYPKAHGDNCLQSPMQVVEERRKISKEPRNSECVRVKSEGAKAESKTKGGHHNHRFLKAHGARPKVGGVRQSGDDKESVDKASPICGESSSHVGPEELAGNNAHTVKSPGNEANVPLDHINNTWTNGKSSAVEEKAHVQRNRAEQNSVSSRNPSSTVSKKVQAQKDTLVKKMQTLKRTLKIDGEAHLPEGIHSSIDNAADAEETAEALRRKVFLRTASEADLRAKALSAFGISDARATAAVQA